MTLPGQAAAAGLAIRGVVRPDASDGVPERMQSIVLLGPDEPRFWPIFQASPEYEDGEPDPLDRWSKRVIQTLASDWNGQAIFPSDGPPYAPFISWAVRSGNSWPAPVGLLVHQDAGLFISYRGAVAIPTLLHHPATSERPCDTCVAPCQSACPVGAMGPDQAYDVPKCQAHVASKAGASCRHEGCLVRRACPAARNFERLVDQSSFHMAAFMRNYVI